MFLVFAVGWRTFRPSHWVITSVIVFGTFHSMIKVKFQMDGDSLHDRLQRNSFGSEGLGYDPSLR